MKVQKSIFLHLRWGMSFRLTGRGLRWNIHNACKRKLQRTVEANEFNDLIDLESVVLINLAPNDSPSNLMIRRGKYFNNKHLYGCPLGNENLLLSLGPLPP